MRAAAPTRLFARLCLAARAATAALAILSYYLALPLLEVVVELELVRVRT